MNNNLDYDALLSAFMLFGGLFGYYSLQRLLPMKLFSLDIPFSSSPLKFSTFGPPLMRFALGCFANLVVTTSFLAAWWWFRFLVPQTTSPSSIFKNLAELSIVISSTSLILVSHRLVAALAIFLKFILFNSSDRFWSGIELERKLEFESFLNSSPSSHLRGALLFVVFQMLFGLTIAATQDLTSLVSIYLNNL